MNKKSKITLAAIIGLSLITSLIAGVVWLGIEAGWPFVAVLIFMVGPVSALISGGLIWSFKVLSEAVCMRKRRITQ